VFAKAREKARQTACLSNCKQIGMAFMQYAQDYDETFPESDQDFFHGVIQPYVKNRDVMSCPSAKNGQQIAYSFNKQLFWNNPGAFSSTALADIKAAADTILAGEAGQFGDGGTARQYFVDSCGGIWSGGNPWGAGADGEQTLKYELNGVNLDIDPPAWGSEPEPWNPCRGNGMPRYRHNEGANFVWADGHAKWRKRGTLQLKNFRFDLYK
jgi:prepilin-type processing-associated H-X9-DG protein